MFLSILEKKRNRNYTLIKTGYYTKIVVPEAEAQHLVLIKELPNTQNPLILQFNVINYLALGQYLLKG